MDEDSAFRAPATRLHYLHKKALSAAGVRVSSVQFKHGAPVFIDNGLTLTATGFLAGLGNEDILMLLGADANPTAVCTNPEACGMLRTIGACNRHKRNADRYAAQLSLSVEPNSVRTALLYAHRPGKKRRR